MLWCAETSGLRERGNTCFRKHAVPAARPIGSRPMPKTRKGLRRIQILKGQPPPKAKPGEAEVTRSQHPKWASQPNPSHPSLPSVVGRGARPPGAREPRPSATMQSVAILHKGDAFRCSFQLEPCAALSDTNGGALRKSRHFRPGAVSFPGARARRCPRTARAWSPQPKLQ